MFRGDWRILITLVGCLGLASAALWSKAPSTERIASPAPSPKEQASGPAEQPQSGPPPLAVSVVETAEQRVAAERAQAESRWHDARDLDAQIRAADAAEEQVFPSWLGVVLSFIGTGLIVWTLCETRIANAVARQEFARARIESKKAYEEARKANEIAQTTADKQLRPYVQFTDPRDSQSKLIFENGEKIDFAFENFGQTPARDVSIRYCWEIMTRPIGDRTIGHFAEAESYGVLAPRQLIKDKFRNGFAPSEIARIAAGEILMIRMRLDYGWGETHTDFHDVTFILASVHGKWEMGQISKQERHRT